MKRRFPSRVVHGRPKSQRRPFRRFTRLLFESLEDRTMLDTGVGSTTPAIVVGRTLSAYFVGAVQNSQETITYTVYNQQADPETGVLLTDTLAPSVTLSSASAQPDQNGQSLAWSLGTINGFDRASVTVTLALPSPNPSQLDTGAVAFATLDAAAVSDTAPAATLRAGSLSDPTLLASTPDANTTDSFIQEKAAELDYNAQSIFNFLHTQIGYNSYLGSVRGARGTLWSNAGNALDTASLGVALMRASGIPAQYVQGTLSKSSAQSLILSMFPASYQTVGYIPAGTQTADPANDPQLLAETESHYWFQFDAGQGFKDADPLLGASVGTTFTTSQSTFTQVPDSLREKTEVSLNAEIYSQANAAFGGSGLTTTTVLDQTFNDVDLVGRPLTVGHFVSSNAQGGLTFTTVTNTYSPYIELGDEAYPNPSQDEILRGKDYQEILTTFPLGSQILTGLFLSFTLTGPSGPPASYERTLLDRIGFAARQHRGSIDLEVSPTDPPIINIADLYVVNVLPGLQDPNLETLLLHRTNEMHAILGQQSTTGKSTASQAGELARQYLIEYCTYELVQYLTDSDAETSNLESAYSVGAYFARPRITLFSSQIDTAQQTVGLSIDLRSEPIRVEPYPGQAIQVAQPFNFTRGFLDSAFEQAIIPTTPSSHSLSSYLVLKKAVAQGVPLVLLSESNLSTLNALSLPSDASARISSALEQGLNVLTPIRPVDLNGGQGIGWYEINPATGEIVGVLENGGHQEDVEYAEVLNAEGDLIGLTTYEVIPPPPPLEGFELVKKDVELTLPLANKFFGPLLEVVGLEVVAHFMEVADQILGAASLAGDPPLQEFLSDFLLPRPDTPRDAGSANYALPSVLQPGLLTESLATSTISITSNLDASWSSSSSSGFAATSLNASNATITSATGATLGSGSVVLVASSKVPAVVSGTVSYNFTGSGNLSFYGPAETSLGVSGNWKNYSATATGNVSITLTTDALTLNGQPLPAGTYTITTSSATLSGSGPSTSPNFSGSASITATSGTFELGPGSGNFAVGGKPLDPTNETTLTGYSGTITVAANGDGTDAVSLDGSADNVLQVTVSQSTFTTDQNTPVTFTPNVQTTFADTYTLTAQAPTGWTVSIDGNGNVTATPAPGLQGGNYPIRVIAQSTTKPDLIAQTVVNVTITPTQFGITLNVAPDPLTTVPFNGAELPTAFIASIHNNGPIAVTENLAFSNIPSGFTLLDSGTSVTIPAGATGSFGVYLQPTGQIPAAGSQYSFAVSTSDIFGQKATQTVTFTIPNIDAVILSGNPPAVNAAPGATATDPIAITNAGNVPEDIVLSSSATSGLTVVGLSNVTLQPGQSVTENVALTPDASTPLNSFLQATITATLGTPGSPQTTLQLPVDVVVPGAEAIAGATASADQLGETSLAARLTDLGTALTNLALNPTDPVPMSQALASLDAVIALLAGDVYLASLTGALTSDRTALAQAATATAIQTALSSLGNDLDSLATTLSDEIAHSLVLKLDPNQGQARPNVPMLYPINIQNTGTQATTYDFSVSGLPSGVTASFNHPSVTLQPGQDLFLGPNGIVLTLTETAGELARPGCDLHGHGQRQRARYDGQRLPHRHGDLL